MSINSIYNINIFNSSSTQIFSGYFTVNPSNYVTAFYENGNSTNLLGPTIMPPPDDWWSATNYFNTTTKLFTDDGMNITSTTLQNALSTVGPWFNLYSEDHTNPNEINRLWQNGEDIVATIVITFQQFQQSSDSNVQFNKLCNCNYKTQYKVVYNPIKTRVSTSNMSQKMKYASFVRKNQSRTTKSDENIQFQFSNL